MATTAARNGLRRPNVGVAGATGAVGIEMRHKLLERNFPCERVRFFAHPSEEGTPLDYGGRTIACESVDERSFDDLDICLFSAGGDFSAVWAPKAAAAGCIVVDNSSKSGPHMVHSHTVHLPLGALLSRCTMCGTGPSSAWTPTARSSCRR